MFLCALLCAFALWALLNVLVDPFNAFGDPVLSWDAYTQTRNPRLSKLVYVSERFDLFDSYVIGSSNAASYRPETLDALTGAHFYNMFHYGTDTDYDRRLVEYLVERDEVRNIVLVLGMNDANSVRKNDGSLDDAEHYALTGGSAFGFYLKFAFGNPKYAFEKLASRARDTELPQSFDVFLPESGCYDKRVRDVEPIGSLDDYLARNGADFETSGGAPSDLALIDECVGDVAEIRRVCDEAGVSLTVIVVPVYEGQLDLFTESSVDRYFSRLAEVTDYVNFALSPISFDARYFYDLTHTRNSTADMTLRSVFGGEGYAPSPFGYFCRKGEPVPTVAEMRAAAEAAEEDPVTLPVLLYHHLSETEEEGSTVVSPATLERHLELIRSAGYVPVTLGEIADHVEKGTPLPEDPVLITFDDGYLSNYELARPLLERYGAPAVIFVIGSSFGRDTYKDTGLPIIPHFGAREAAEMEREGLISLQSHSYDMHQWPPYEESGAPRDSMLRLDGESEDAYYAALIADADAERELFTENGLEPPDALSFPKGLYDTVCDAALAARGYRFTFTTDASRTNVLVRGLPQTLFDLGRYNLSGDTTDAEILEYLSKAGK